MNKNLAAWSEYVYRINFKYMKQTIFYIYHEKNVSYNVNPKHKRSRIQTSALHPYTKYNKIDTCAVAILILKIAQ